MLFCLFLMRFIRVILIGCIVLFMRCFLPLPSSSTCAFQFARNEDNPFSVIYSQFAVLCGFGQATQCSDHSFFCCPLASTASTPSHSNLVDLPKPKTAPCHLTVSIRSRKCPNVNKRPPRPKTSTRKKTRTHNTFY